MMTPLETSWSVHPWTRIPIDDDPPSPLSRHEAEEMLAAFRGAPDDASVTLRASLVRALLEPLAAAPSAGRDGAMILDHDRHVTYRATLDERRELDYLAVEVSGHIDDNVMRRVPVARIRREVLGQVSAAERARASAPGEDVVVMTLPGGLSERPSLAEVADRLREGWDRARFHAEYGHVPPRTVDGWMRRARQKYPTAPHEEQAP